MEITSLTMAVESANGPNDLAQLEGAASHAGGSNDNDEQNEGEGIVHGPTVLAHVDLARTVGTLLAISTIYLLIG
jgi:hypothetical protein